MTTEETLRYTPDVPAEMVRLAQEVERMRPVVEAAEQETDLEEMDRAAFDKGLLIRARVIRRERVAAYRKAKGEG